MTDTAADLKIYGFVLALAVHAGFALHLLRQGYARRGQGAAPQVFLGAVVASAGWALMSLLDPLSRSVTPAFAAAVLDLLRYALWFGFLLLLLRPALARNAARESQLLAPAAGLLIALAAALLAYRAALGLYEPDSSRAYLGATLALPLLGMVLVEQLFRNLTEDSRWNAKPLCLGLAIVFLFDLYVHSEAVLFGRLDPDAMSVRGVVHLLAVPLLFLSSRRRADWIRRLKVSRSAAFYSATLLLVGAYLLFMSAVGYYVRYFGGGWGRGLQLGLLAVAAASVAGVACPPRRPVQAA
jgi:hypothetical protein